MSPGDEHEAAGGYAGTGHTRTRLPDNEPYGARRGGRSSSRSLVTVVGVVVLLIAAIAFANRGGDDSTSTEESASGPEATSTAASGERPVDSKSGGVPAGFGHDRQGAESAAANYAVVLVSADFLKPVRRTEIVRQVFVADKQAALEGKFNQTYSKEFLKNVGLDAKGNATAGSTYVSRTMPIGTKVTTYSDTGATVEVWCTGVFGTTGERSTNPVTSDWFTMTLQLRWADGDWKIESFSQEDGPAPVPGDDRASSADDMAKAVEEYGGFTYAR
ncbi:hypothetical protein I2W78_20835 [Streptomyces spinoverrucosus]|uniref:hypothetical protein n=1 Tax=Streptomyces spinoverrucosus TaxID=284043 RepID=UPI0018C3EF15|nr:hypothetical protein [Streptomyces spinoverrucosus]MBG0854213.1 hypothetical protein [Streptomyces spinoverrucosus]